MNPQQVITFQNFLNTALNPEQKKAVEEKTGSFLVIAGAGSGKTRVITARITNLIINHNVEPSSIIALTFTNKAAQEMQHRIAHFLPNLRTKPIIATFHSYCLRLLKKYFFIHNLPNCNVIDASDAQKLLQSIIKEKGMDKLFNAKQLLSFFSTLKMNEILNQELPVWNMHHYRQLIELYRAYEQQKKLSNYLDFDDLLYKTYEIFNKDTKFHTQHLQNHRHILVDEYQDTNVIQHALLKKMTLDEKNMAVDSVCAVGDEDQSIYSWRGATVTNILDFHKDFANTQKIKLEQNYRSTQQILDIANSVIRHNTQRNHKQLWSSSSKEHKPMMLECLSDLQEAALITQLIQLISKTESKSSIAILYRTHYQSRIIEEALIKDSIPYKMIGGISFYERKEIKDLLAYLRLLHNPYDRISFFRIINCPTRGLGEKFEEQFTTLWTMNSLSSWQEIAQMMIEQNMLATKQKTSLQQFLTFFQIQDQTSCVDLLQHFLGKTEYLRYLQEGFEKAEANEKKENISEFLRAAAYFDEHTSNAGLSLFLDEIALMQELVKQDDQAADRVQMMTLHSAKGLEFNTVMLVGVEEGILPSSQSISQENIEEERRLFYVGITRACQKLLIMHTKYRNVFGKLDEQRPSRFLQEIDSKNIFVQPASHWSKSSFATFFQAWINNETSIKTNSLPVPKPANQSIQNSELNQEFKRLQAVKHEIFGMGIAHHIDNKGDKIFVTVHFAKHGTKKIESSFLTIV